MSAPKVNITKEQLSQKLANLSFKTREPQITTEHWVYRERAAVRIEYDLSELYPDDIETTPESREALRNVLAESIEINNEKNGYTCWRLQHNIRHETLFRLSKQNRLQDVLNANPASHLSTLQEMLDAYVLGNVTAVEEQTLDQLEATIQVINWLNDCVPELPDENKVRRHIAHERLLKPFHFLVRDQFHGREQELRELREYVGILVKDTADKTSKSLHNNFDRNPPFLIYGPGGIGKSTLIAKFILEHADIESGQRIPYVFIDFNRRDIDIQDATSILLEACRQLAIQYPIDEKLWDRLEKEWRQNLDELTSEEDTGTYQVAIASYQRRSLKRYLYEFVDSIQEIQNAKQPFLMIFDTFEELLYRNIEYLDNLWHFLIYLNKELPNLRIVISGRSPLPAEYTTQKLLLSGIDHQSALELLIGKGLPDKDFAEQVIEITGTSPLSLWLATDLFHRLKGDKNILDDLKARQEYFFQVKEYLIQGQLYKRILGHIHDSRVRAMAHPGMVLRRISPDLILNVLGEPCGIEVRNIDDAKNLFEKLKNEVALIDINQTSSNELRQRPELRLAMLELLLQDEGETVKLIHQKGISYFHQRIEEQTVPDVRDLADEIYHRLSLKESPKFLDNYTLDDLKMIADELRSNIQDLPVKAQTYIVSRVNVDIKLDPSVWADADLESWEFITAHSVQNLLNLERYEEALKKLTTREDRTIGSPLYPLHVLALIGLNRKEAINGVLEEGIRRTPPNSPELLELFLLTASIAEEEQQFDNALESYHRALKIAKFLGDTISFLRIQLNIYRLSQVQFPNDDPEIQSEYANLIETIDAVSDEEMRQHPAIIRDLATQIGAKSPGMVKRAVRLVGLSNEKPSNVNSLARALASWDDLRSSELDEDPGLLVRSVKAEWRGDLYQTWFAYLEENLWGIVTRSLERLIETHPLTPTLCITLVELLKSRLLLTTKQATLLQAVLLDVFTSDELHILIEDKLSISLAQISRSDDLTRQVTDLVGWSEANGKTTQLLQALIVEHPNHPQLIDLLGNLGIDYRPILTLSDPEQAITYYHKIMENVSDNEDQQTTADALMRLGNAYLNRVKDDLSENLERAIGYFEKAVLVYSQETFPKEWAAIQNNLGNAFTDRKQGDREENLELAIQHFQQALVIYNRETFPENLATTQNNLGKALEAQGKLNEAHSAYEKALIIDEEMLGSHHPNVARDLNNLGRILQEIGKLIEAQAAYEKALAIDEEVFGPNHRNVALDLNYIGGVHHNLGDIQQATKFYKKALSIAKSNGNRQEEGNILGNLGSVSAAVGATRQAIEFYGQSLTIAEEFDDLRASGIVLSNLGVAYNLLGHSKKAIEYYKQALSIAEQRNNRLQVGSVLGNLGLAYANLGYIDRASECYQQSLAIAREIGDRSSEGTSLGNLGLIYANLAQSEQAINYYEQSLAIAREIGDRSSEGSTLGNLGRIYADLSEFEKAIEYYQQSLAIAREIGDRRTEGTTLGNLGLIYANLVRFKQAIEYYQQSLAIARETGDRRSEGTTLGNLGLTYVNLAQFEQAIEYCQQSLAIAREIGDRHTEGTALGNLGLAYANLDLHKRAIEYYEQSLEISIAINDSQSVKEITSLIEKAKVRNTPYKPDTVDLDGGRRNVFKQVGQSVKVDQYNVAADLSKGSVVNINIGKVTLVDLIPTVCRSQLIKQDKTIYHTAFLVANSLILTVYHAIQDVIEGDLSPQNLIFRFDLLTTSSNEYLSQGQAYALAIGREAQVRFQSKRPWLLAADKNVDYALLRLVRPAGEEVPEGLRKGKPRGWLTLSEKTNLSQGDILGTILFRQGDQITVTSKENAFINYSSNRQRLNHRFETYPGDSGAPIFNADQEVVGMHQSKGTYNRDSIGVSISSVVDDLKKKGLWPLK